MFSEIPILPNFRFLDTFRSFGHSSGLRVNLLFIFRLSFVFRPLALFAIPLPPALLRKCPRSLPYTSLFGVLALRATLRSRCIPIWWTFPSSSTLRTFSPLDLFIRLSDSPRALRTPFRPRLDLSPLPKHFPVRDLFSQVRSGFQVAPCPGLRPVDFKLVFFDRPRSS